MILCIVRHGIAIDREDPKCPPDPERYLTEEGLKKTGEVAKGVASLEMKPDLFLSSPYVRAMQTAEIFADVFGYSKGKIRQTKMLLPGAEPGAFFRELGQEKRAHCVFAFGHAPHVDQSVAVALGSKHPVTALKKAGIAALELRRVSPPSGTLLWLATSKLLRLAGK